jgi:thiamine pyrophosphate-dependent enzyme
LAGYGFLALPERCKRRITQAPKRSSAKSLQHLLTAPSVISARAMDLCPPACPRVPKAPSASLPALVRGAALADLSRRTVLITGEGSHQLTGNEIGNYGRHGIKPIIFVLNNQGFAVERVLEEYPDWVYNDLAPWDYHTLPAALGCVDWFTAKVTTNAELDAAMATASQADTACYIEIVYGKHDYPAGAKLLHSRIKELYGI